VFSDATGVETMAFSGEAAAEPLVSVIIPAYDAAATIAETIESALAQTHRRIEVVVVDDGSTDATAAIAARFAARDPRLRLLSTPNRGVAAARNAGIAESAGAFVAPLDADDLWHPSTLARQLRALETAGPDAGFAYAWFRRIDMEGRVIENGAPRVCVGRAFTRLVATNFVGNGSGLLLRRAAIEGVGGYHRALRAQDAGGSEDHLAQILIAARWDVAATRAYLVGYRYRPGAMSADWRRMLRSDAAVLRAAEAAAKGAPARLFAVAWAAHAVRSGVVGLRTGDPSGGLRDMGRGFLLAPGPAAATLFDQLRSGFRGLLRRRRHAAAREPRPLFRDADPDAGVVPPRTHPLDPWLASLSAWETEATRPHPIRPVHGRQSGAETSR
jgi:hypothetical protein